MVLMKAGAIRDIYATSVDYDSNSEKTLEFCKTIQSKMHYAVSVHTAAEIIYSRSDATKDNMGLTSWAGERVQKNDVTIAKITFQKRRSARSTVLCRCISTMPRRWPKSTFRCI